MAQIRETAVYGAIDEGPAFSGDTCVAYAAEDREETSPISPRASSIIVFNGESKAVEFAVHKLLGSKKIGFGDRLRLIVWNFTGDKERREHVESDMETAASLLKARTAWRNLYDAPSI